jgi:phosphoglycolate phosphatase-like HAD superfamily hydrolase
MICFIDLDMTLADQSDRLAAAGKEPARGNTEAMKKWLSKLQSYETMIQDRPFPATIPLVRSLFNSGWQIIYLTGRSQEHRSVTEEWLAKHRYPKAPLIMRSNNDWRCPSIYKIEKMQEYLETKSKNEVIMVIDDDHNHKCSEQYRKVFNAYHLKTMGDR